MLSEYAILNIIRTLKASQEYSSEDDLGEFLKLLDGVRWRKYPDETPGKNQRVLISLDGMGLMLVSYNADSWKKYQYDTHRWLPIPEVEK